MTPEERQLLTALSDRLKAAQSQQRDPEAEQMIRQLLQDRPDAPYLMAQTVIMQDFALRNAQAQITELQRQAGAAQQDQPRQGGSFLGGLFGGAQQPAPPPAGPWGRPAQPQQYAQPQPQQYAQPQPGPAYGGPVMQPSQTSGFLRSAAQTAVGVAGGALLFEGIQSLFSGHQGFGGGWGGGGFTPTESISETTVVNNNYYDDDKQTASDQSDQGSGTQDASWDSGQDDDDVADFDDNSSNDDFV
ncbi:MAG TPA: DUF2076 domain-containing protein [Aliidongia sp.]|nr:DUF2076 domain-containing protein [Aliidongia sp.]